MAVIRRERLRVELTRGEWLELELGVEPGKASVFAGKRDRAAAEELLTRLKAETWDSVDRWERGGWLNDERDRRHRAAGHRAWAVSDCPTCRRAARRPRGKEADQR